MDPFMEKEDEKLVKFWNSKNGNNFSNFLSLFRIFSKNLENHFVQFLVIVSVS